MAEKRETSRNVLHFSFTFRDKNSFEIWLPRAALSGRKNGFSLRRASEMRQGLISLMAQSDPVPHREPTHVLLFPRPAAFCSLRNQFIFPRVATPEITHLNFIPRKTIRAIPHEMLVTLTLAAPEFFHVRRQNPRTSCSPDLFPRETAKVRALKVAAPCLIIHPSDCCCWL